MMIRSGGVIGLVSSSMITVVDSSDPRLSDYLDLNDPAERARREGDEFFIVEGPTAIHRLTRSGHRIRSLLVTEQAAARMADVIDALDDHGTPVYVTTRAVLAAVAGFDLHRGAVAAADRAPLPGLAEVLATARTIAVLEGLNDPENLGAIARSARALGIDALVCDPTCIDPYYRRSVRVSMGAILFLPVVRAAPWPAALEMIGAHGFTRWAMTPDPGATSLYEVDLPDRCAVVLGPEGPGLAGPTIATCDLSIRIPMASGDGADSLNVAAAAAITFAEISRRRALG